MTTLLELHTEIVRPQWIDYNGHLNLAYYLLAFDHATDAFFDYLGIGPAYLAQSHRSTFTLEAHITYEREVREGAPLRFSTQLLDYDHQRIHYFHRMFHAGEGYLAATNELISLHVDMATRRSTPMGEAVLERLEALWRDHGHQPHPEQAGRVIGIRR